eukprot:7062560-Alexandrium_andersonii.AAC.1
MAAGTASIEPFVLIPNAERVEVSEHAAIETLARGFGLEAPGTRATDEALEAITGNLDLAKINR